MIQVQHFVIWQHRSATRFDCVKATTEKVWRHQQVSVDQAQGAKVSGARCCPNVVRPTTVIRPRVVGKNVFVDIWTKQSFKSRLLILLNQNDVVTPSFKVLKIEGPQAGFGVFQTLRIIWGGSNPHDDSE